MPGVPAAWLLLRRRRSPTGGRRVTIRVIHRPSPTGGRRVTIRGQIAGLAYDDQDVTEFLRRAGLPDAEQLLDRPEWRGGRAHTYAAA